MKVIGDLNREVAPEGYTVVCEWSDNDRGNLQRR